MIALLIIRYLTNQNNCCWLQQFPQLPLSLDGTGEWCLLILVPDRGGESCNKYYAIRTAKPQMFFPLFHLWSFTFHKNTSTSHFSLAQAGLKPSAFNSPVTPTLLRSHKHPQKAKNKSETIVEAESSGLLQIPTVSQWQSTKVGPQTAENKAPPKRKCS